MLIGRENAPIGATECYGFPVGGFGSWHLSEEEKAEREKEYREKYCTDKPNDFLQGGGMGNIRLQHCGMGLSVGQA